MTIIENAQLLYLPPLAELRFLPEGPYPCGDQKFSWVGIQHGADIPSGSINIFDMVTHSNESWCLPFRPGFAFACNRENHFVVGGDRALGIYSGVDGSFRTFATEIERGVEGTIINDGITWNGNLLFGCKDLQFREAKAGLYFWRGEDNKLIQLRDDQTCSNGKAILEDSGASIQFLDIDTPTKQVVCYELWLATGKLSPAKVVLDLRACDDFPDGMILTPDRKSIVISFYNPHPAEFGETRQYRLLDGQLERIWRTPAAPQATCPQWIAHQGRVSLIITTAVEHMSAEAQSQALNSGGLFMAATEYANPGINPSFPLESLPFAI